MTNPRPMKYRCPQTLQTWSGRGLQPAWLKAALSEGAKLEDFVVQDEAAPATALTVPPTAAHSPVRALAQQLRYEGATDPATLENSAREAIRRIGMGIFELGGYLLLLRESCPHGTFLPALERIGIAPRAAQQYMSVTLRFAANTKLTSHLGTVSATKMVELLPLDDDQVDELLLTGQTGELALDDVATMSVKELRAAVREAKEERKAQEDLSAAKSKQIDKLKLQLKRIQAAPPDEVLADLKKEATALANAAQGLIMGTLRLAVQAIADHGDDGLQTHRAFLAGLLAPLQVELTALRHEFELPDLADEAVKTPFVQFADAEDRAEAAAAASQRAKG